MNLSNGVLPTGRPSCWLKSFIGLGSLAMIKACARVSCFILLWVSRRLSAPGWHFLHNVHFDNFFGMYQKWCDLDLV